MTGVRQGGCLSPILFAMYVNDIEREFITKGADGVDLGFMKLFLLLYADDNVIFSESAVGLQHGLDLLQEYCQRWRLTVNPNKSKIILFRKGGVLPQDLVFRYGDINLEIVSKFIYLGIVFTTGGLSRQAQKSNLLYEKVLKQIC